MFLVGVHVAALTNNRFIPDSPITPAAANLATLATIRVRRTAQAAAIAVVSSDNTQVGVSSNNYLTARILANDSKYIPLGMVLTPDSSVDMNWLATAITDTTDSSLEWYEE